MNEEADLYLSMAEDAMSQTINYLDKSLSRIRAGKASVNILDGIRVDYYGTMTALNGVATLSTPDAKTIAIQPWEKKMLPTIEKAIMASPVGINPVNNGEVIILSIPPLTEERRRALGKQVRQEAEDAKVAVRNTRRDCIDSMKKLVKDGMSEDLGKDYEARVQQIHDKYIKKVDEIAAAKDKEIMTV